MFRFKAILIFIAGAAIAGCATSGSQPGQPAEEQQLASDAAGVLQTQMEKPMNQRIPAALVENARCIGVFPAVNQAAFIVGGRHGRGLIACRQSNSQGWNDAAPAVYSLSAGSIGFQAGAEQSSVILLFMTPQSTQRLTDNNVKLGADVGIAAGPLGWNADVHRTPAPVISYQSSKGLFAGVNLNGTSMSFDQDATQNVYGQQVSDPGQVLFQSNRVPSSVDRFSQALAQLESSSRQQPGYGSP
ncbi:MAG TPA: lipid-binding SYLF domain-containing protein [Gammaproteobacteria bacterium]|jgi:lipid-binding SYLF domain-containing protein|nr:lipid-binding SYLF domain-containing protein [Gammaproteobacteria bacterium]